MTALEFQNNATKREALQKVLKSPILIEALEILENEVEPLKDLPVTLASETISAHRYHQFAGLYHVTKGLKRLSKMPPEPPKPLTGKTLRTPKKETP